MSILSGEWIEQDKALRSVAIINWVKESESEVIQPCPTICDPMDCSLLGSSIHGILQARILEQVAISSSGGSSRHRDWTQVFLTAGRLFTINWVSTCKAQQGIQTELQSFRKLEVRKRKHEAVIRKKKIIRRASDMKTKRKESRKKTWADAVGYQEEQERVERRVVNRNGTVPT